MRVRRAIAACVLTIAGTLVMLPEGQAGAIELNGGVSVGGLLAGTTIPTITVSMVIVGPVGATGSFSATNSVGFQPNLATANCIDGSYAATAIFTLTAPPGYWPPTHTEQRVQTNTVKCNGGQ